MDADEWSVGLTPTLLGTLALIVATLWYFHRHKDPLPPEEAQSTEPNEVPQQQPLEVGDRVQLSGLVARAELNGKDGLVLGFDEASQRYMVELERHSSWDEQPVKIKLKLANLIRSERSSPGDCAICMCEAVRPVRLQCEHVFCSACISRLRSQALQDSSIQDTCPLCRAAIGDDAGKHFLAGAIELIRLEMPHEGAKWAVHEKGCGRPTSTSAIAHLERALTHDPDHLGSLITLGELLLDKEPAEPERALVLLRRAVSLDPSESHTHLALGKALERTGDLEGALASNERAAGCIGGSKDARAAALMQAAQVHEQKGHIADAVECLRQAAAATPDDHIVPFNLGVCLEESDVDGAIAAMERCLKLDPTFYKAYYSLAAGYRGGLYRRKIVDANQRSEGLTAQKWASAALTASKMVPRSGPESKQEMENIEEALQLVSTAFRSNYMNVVERMDGTVTPRHANQPFNDCDSFGKWVDEHDRMMAQRRRQA